ncbi:Serine/threonine-protein kinase ppk30 [Ceratocystis platani]|uniref:non-specific serine/threonine protein kinase n=1 Tax=Ceratocystis fimbriata f. sp. platani TaxID=88771 RepID=A0A0F8D949_CERFI|nr:Serine/threonine-protein kinase ppk30 [Ceratocystis platani]
MASAPSNHVQMHLPMGASQPPGTFSPGTKIQVGSHRVIIQKYLSEGGFAHVYLVKLPMPVDGTDMAVLKRVAVPDKDTLRGMRTEVETMKRLKGHKPIVTYIDSHASEMKGGGYEVFLLMEFCNGGGLIDFMNTRLQHRLTEPEILKIFSDVAEGVACMHYLKPALLHRDLKVENVLITNRSDGSKRFKVCDFGSVAPPRPAPTTVAECRQIDDDIQRHTTLQYRSPEMVDVYRMQPIDEKSDIWALGVLLYKLCYYTTPFEDQGQLAILNASLRFPSYPQFSDRLRNLIAAMLREAPSSRPNIYQVLKEACRVSHTAKRPSPSPMRVISGDPFAALDSTKTSTATPAAAAPPSSASAPPKLVAKPPTVLSPPANMESADELSARFPTLDQFSLLHDQGNKFDFDSNSPRNLDQRVTEKLVDEAFAYPLAKSISSAPVEPPRPRPEVPSTPASVKPPASAGGLLVHALDRSLDKSRPSQDLGGEDLEYLRNAMETEPKKSKSSKRSSLSLSGTKNILAGKFGDAFKRFESHHHSSPFKKQAAPRSPSPKKDLRDSVLTPIAGSEATDGRSDDGQNSEDEQDMTPEMRREFERLQLAEEERRVEAAQAEYRRRLTERKSGSPMSPSPDTGLPKSIGGVSRAVSIQNRVQSLLGEEQRNAPVQRTAQGYGRYTESAEPAPSPQQYRGPTDRPPPEILRKPVRTMTSETQLRVKNDPATGGGGSAARPPLPPKPVAPRKPGHLNGMPTGRSASPTKGLAPAQPIMAANSSATTTAKPESPGAGTDPNYLSDFSKRFPSLSAIEMVDMDLDKK